MAMDDTVLELGFQSESWHDAYKTPVSNLEGLILFEIQGYL